MLAAIMRESRLGMPSRIVLFLGAGASCAAGVPLADGLKDLVAADVFGSHVPTAVQNGRLEDAMEVLQELGGRDGYELVANRLRGYTSPPDGYNLLLDLVSCGYLEAILTTNMDQLLELAAETRTIAITSLAAERDFEAAAVTTGSLMVAHIHGICREPGTMKGSWTDASTGLSVEKSAVITNLISRYVTVFVGYAALDPDIFPLLRTTSSNDTRIFWVDPNPKPSGEIAELLAAFSSAKNYIPMQAEEFFRDLHDLLFPLLEDGRPDVTPVLRQIASGTEQQRLERERGYARDRAFSKLGNFGTQFFGTLAEAVVGTGMRASHGTGSVEFADSNLGDCEAVIASSVRGDTLEGPFLEISTGGPNLIVGLHIDRVADLASAKVLAYVIYISSTPKPVWRREVWSCEQIELKLLDNAEFKRMQTWLGTKVYAMYENGLKKLLTVLR